VAEIALGQGAGRARGLPAERLYYHLGQMEQARLVRIAEYRPLSGGNVERVYADATVEPPGDEATLEDMARFLGAVLQATRDFFETVTLSGARLHALAVIEHASRRTGRSAP
jgi:hypothetical protein